MTIVVTKSPPVIVRPSEPPPPPMRVIEKLSSFDKVSANSLLTLFLVFDPIHDTAYTIKRALSQALVHYYPFAGRIIAADDGEFHVLCNGEGVTFVAATANCALNDIKLFHVSNGKTTISMTMLDELDLYQPKAEGCGPTDPLLLMQVTEFTCGGFVLGVTWNHGIADGVGVAQFLRAVGELACGSPSPSVVPVRWDPLLPSYPPSIVELVVRPNPIMLVAPIGVTIPLSLINHIKASFRDHSSGQTTCTTFEVVAAVLWQCRTRAIISDPDAIALLSFAVNMRKHVGAKDGYYGNCIAGHEVMETTGMVAKMDIIDLVKMIKRSKDKIPGKPADQLLLSNKGGDFSEMIRDMDEQHRDRLQYNTLILSSWRNIGFEEVDFGGGTPARVMCYVSPPLVFPLCITNLPCKGEDGPSNVFSVCVKEEHADAFVAELARFNM
ncbi:hypothetical protein QOZ80_8AG0631480 [Eleusine coracana subsp. coracana]|nr:hypothetical protein QOZ80_8AG0631480 [Eleusine coracana subsp. coracana]